MESDAQLLSRYTDTGSETAFRELVERYLPLVRGIVWRQSSRPDLVDDVAMQVFAAVAQKATELQKRDSLGGWIVVAARMKVAEHLRNQDTRRRHMKNFSDNETATTTPGLPDANLWDEATPVLDEALTALPESDREAVVLHFYHGLPYREVGERLGSREDATRKRVNKALERMAAFFKRRGIALPAATIATGLGATLTSTSHAAGTLSPAAIATAALKVSTPATAVATSTLLTMSTTKTSTTLLAAAVLVLLSAGTGYIAGHQRGTARKESIISHLAPPAHTALPSDKATAPGTAADPRPTLRQILGEIVALSQQVSQRPSAWSEIGHLRGQIRAGQFPTALDIAHDDYATDPRSLQTLVGYLIADWAKFDARAATAKAVEIAHADRAENLLTQTLGEWGDQDATAALEWLESQEQQIGSGTALRLNGYIYGGWARSDPGAAFDAFEALDYDRQRAVIGKLWLAMQDESARAPFIARTAQVKDERLRIDILERSISESLNGHPRELAAAFDRLQFENPSIRRRGLDHVTDQLFVDDPATATQWIWERAIDDDHRSEILLDWVASGWARQDRGAASEWLTSQGYAPEEWLGDEPPKQTNP